MRSAGIVRGVVGAFAIVVSIASFAGAQDTLTEPPTLTAPASGSVNTLPIAIALTLPEAALPGELGCPTCGS
jgi:hypothetical protein